MASTTKGSRTGIHATKGHTGGVRGALWPLSPVAVGLASALAAGGALAQDAASPPAQPPVAPAAVQEAQTPAAQPAPAEPDKTFVLPTVQVVEEAEGYHTPESGLTRLPKALVDTPQSVTVVPERVLEEQKVTTVREALRNVSGITVAAGEGGRQGDSFILRGFSAQTDVSRDGVRDLGWFTRDTFNLGGVEVFFGPSSVLFGRGSTGGAINLVTKKPQRRSFQEVRVIGGTAPSGRVELDINQALSERLQVRLDVMGQLAGVASRDAAEQNRLGVAPSARLELGERTSLEFDYLYQREDSIPDYGQPYFNGYPVSESLGVPRETFYGVAGSDTEEVDAHVATARLQHRFGEGLRLTNTLRYGRVDRFARPTSPRGLTPAAAPTAIGRQRYETETDNTNLINQTDLRGEFQTGPLAHTLNVGAELSRETRDQLRYNLNAVGLPTGANLPADLFSPNPEPDLSVLNRVFNNANDTRQTTLALYAADQVAVTKYLEVLGSLRVDRFSTDYALTSADGTRTPLENSDTLFNWRAGLVVHPLEQTSLYAMYGTSSNPSAEAGALTVDTVSLEPEQNAITELGAKADLLEERLGVSGAVFQVRKLNARVPNTDPEGPPQILAGEQRVRGFNVGLAGAPREGWQVTANYTYMDSEIREHTNAYLVGQRLPNTPEHSVSLWTTLEVLEGLTLGGGAIYQSVTVVNNPTSEAQAFNKVPNYWRFDAYASYAFKRVELQLNLNNLSDAFYYEQYYSGHAVPAAGRSATLTGSFRF